MHFLDQRGFYIYLRCQSLKIIFETVNLLMKRPRTRLSWNHTILLHMIRGATEDGATCCRTHKLHVFPYFITIGDVLQHKLHSIITIGVALQIIYFTVAVML